MFCWLYSFTPGPYGLLQLFDTPCQIATPHPETRMLWCLDQYLFFITNRTSEMLWIKSSPRRYLLDVRWELSGRAWELAICATVSNNICLVIYLAVRLLYSPLTNPNSKFKKENMDLPIYPLGECIWPGFFSTFFLSFFRGQRTIIGLVVNILLFCQMCEVLRTHCTICINGLTIITHTLHHINYFSHLLSLPILDE